MITVDGDGEWELRLLGPVEVYRGGVHLPLNGKRRSLLAVLLLNANRVVAIRQRAEARWAHTALDRFPDVTRSPVPDGVLVPVAGPHLVRHSRQEESNGTHQRPDPS